MLLSYHRKTRAGVPLALYRQVRAATVLFVAQGNAVGSSRSFEPALGLAVVCAGSVAMAASYSRPLLAGYAWLGLNRFQQFGLLLRRQRFEHAHAVIEIGTNCADCRIAWQHAVFVFDKLQLGQLHNGVKLGRRLYSRNKLDLPRVAAVFAAPHGWLGFTLSFERHALGRLKLLDLRLKLRACQLGRKHARLARRQLGFNRLARLGLRRIGLRVHVQRVGACHRVIAHLACSLLFGWLHCRRHI
jgi:hypothetical protein